MLSVNETMMLTTALVSEGVQDTVDWIRRHTDEECLAYLDAHGRDQMESKPHGTNIFTAGEDSLYNSIDEIY